MISFKEDWYIPQYENNYAIAETNTLNTSFLKMAVILKKLGIENNLFPLALVFPELAGLDPHNLKDNSKELKMKIGIECKINPWYYFRNCMRIPAQGGTIPYDLNRANLALMWTFFNNIDAYLCVSRQLTKTVSTQAIYSWVLYIGGYKLNSSMFVQNRKLVVENIQRLRSIRDSLPKYLIKNLSSKDTDNKEGLGYAALENRYLTFVVPESEYDANNVGRGMSLNSQHWDEFGYMKNNKIAYSVAITSGSTASAQARERGLPCSNIITTTAALLDSEAGKYAYSIMNKALKFSEDLYDLKNKKELENVVQVNSENRMIYISYSFLQLGKDWDWFHEVTTRANKTKDEIDTDYLLIWKSGATNSAIPSDLLKKIKDSEIKPIYVETDKIDHYRIKWYVTKSMRQSELFKNKKLIIGMDSSENIGRDSSTLVLIDPEDMSLVGLIKCNESNITKFARFTTKLLLEFKKSIFIPERKSSGSSIIDYILMEFEAKGINPYTRIYNQVVQNMEDKRFKNINMMNFPMGEERKYFGFSTDHDSRHNLYKNILIKALEYNHTKIYDSDLISEFCGLTVRNGRIDHALRGHDDTVFGYLLTCFLIYEGNNLWKYGLNVDDYLNNITIDGKEININEINKHEQYKREIHELEKKIKMTSSLIIRKSYEKKLNMLLKLYDESIVPTEIMSKEKIKHDTIDTKFPSIQGLTRYFSLTSKTT